MNGAGPLWPCGDAAARLVRRPVSGAARQADRRRDGRGSGHDRRIWHCRDRDRAVRHRHRVDGRAAGAAGLQLHGRTLRPFQQDADAQFHF